MSHPPETEGPRGETATAPRRDWPAYYHANAGRLPRTLFVTALGLFAQGSGRQAMDLGCGDGTETLALLEQGWRVLAIDGEPDAIARVQARTPAHLRPLLETEVAAFHHAHLRPSEFIYAGVSLPFCPPQYFAGVWAAVRASLLPGGRLACHLFGDRDDWTRQQEMTFQRRHEAEALLDGLVIERFAEVEEDGQSFAGPKHWHFFEMIARAPDAS